MKLNFTEADSDRANTDWGANCGPHSLAAALWLDLSTVRDFMPEFAAKGFTTPTMIEAALDRAGIRYERTTKLRTTDLCEGISRIQWDGPWLKPGVPFGAAYQKTHWVAHSSGFVFCTAIWAPFGWTPIADWRKLVVDCCQEIKACTGWHVTHHYAFEVLAKGGG